MPSFLSSIFGSKPKVPQLPTLDLATEVGKANETNQKNLTASESIVGKANQFSQEQITKMLDSVIPGFSTNIAPTIAANLASEAKGEVPKDVQDFLQNRNAGTALKGGYAGSGAHGDLVARDLGITSLDLTNSALTSTESWMRTAGSLYEPQMMNLTSMFVNPQQQASFDQGQNMQQFQRSWMENQIGAMPDPVAKGVWDMTLGGVKDLIVGKSGTTNWGGMAGGGGGGMGAGYENAMADAGSETAAYTGATTTAGSGGL
jgi:hypothetical protein